MPVAVAQILFEGSLTLQLSELREIGTVVRRLVTLGAEHLDGDHPDGIAASRWACRR